MNSYVVESCNDIETLRRDWNNLLKSSGSDVVFLTIEWLICWLRSINILGNQFIVTVRENGKIVAIAPLIILEIEELGLKFRKLQFIGAPNADYLDFIIVGDRSRCISELMQFIEKKRNLWDYFELAHIRNDSPNYQYFVAFSQNIFSGRFSKEHSMSPFLTLPLSYENYLKERDKRIRYDLKRGENDLRQIGDLKFERITEREIALKELQNFFKMLEIRQDIKNRKGTLAGTTMARTLMTSFIENEEMWNNTNFAKISLNENPIAYHLGFEYGKSLYWYKPTFDLNFSRHGPGKILINFSLKDAINRGLIELDFLEGNEPYKYQWTKTQRNIFNFSFSSNLFKSKALLFWFCSLKPAIKNLQWLKKTILLTKGRT